VRVAPEETNRADSRRLPDLPASQDLRQTPAPIRPDRFATHISSARRSAPNRQKRKQTFRPVAPHASGPSIRGACLLQTTSSSKISVHANISDVHDNIIGTHGNLIGMHGNIIGMHGNLIGMHGNILGTHGNIIVMHGNIIGTRGNIIVMHGNIIGTRGNLIGMHGNLIGMHGNIIGTHGNNIVTHDNIWDVHGISRTCQVRLFCPGFRPGYLANP